MAYLDVIGMLLLAGVCFVVFSKKRKAGKNIIYTGVVSGTAVVALCVMFFLEASLGKGTFLKAFFSWCCPPKNIIYKYYKENNNIYCRTNVKFCIGFNI